jgi:integrase/recombinase XerD
MDNKEQILLRIREDIRLRGLSQNTLVNYILHARIFLEFSNRPVEQLDPIDIRNFLWHLINEKKVSPATVNAYSAAIRFLFAVTLNRTLNYLQIPCQKIRKTLPEVLTRQEVFSIMENCKNLKHKAMLMVVYSSGLRVLVVK